MKEKTNQFDRNRVAVAKDHLPFGRQSKHDQLRRSPSKNQYYENEQSKLYMRSFVLDFGESDSQAQECDNHLFQ